LVAVACWLPAMASAAPMPAGTYDVELTNGTIDIGDGVLPPLTLGSGTTFTAAIGTAPIVQPIGLTVESLPISLGNPGDFITATGTLGVTILGAGITVDPATGNATVDASFYATVTLNGKVVGISVAGTCAIGTPQSPVVVHLDSAKGSGWDPATGAFSMVDNTFAVARSCGSSLNDIVAILFGNTDIGDNTAILNGIATRRADPAPSTSTPPPVVTTSQPPATTPAPTSGNPNEVTPLVNAPATAKACVVPKLVGKTLKQAKRALKKAGCKVGKAKKSGSKKKKGRIVKQRYKVGTKLPAGAKIPLTVSKGPKKARKHRSR
jgi:hypothetical protein